MQGRRKRLLTKVVKYYDLKKNWGRVRPHLGDKALNDILVRDFNKFTFGRWRRKFTYGDLPFETGDWYFNQAGRRPAFWRYVRPGACHWLVNFSLCLAKLVKPKKLWRIITSEEHSTVWDGDDTLFEFNFQAFGIGPKDCFDLAFDKELKLGKYLPVHFAQHYTVEPRLRADAGIEAHGSKV